MADESQYKDQAFLDLASKMPGRYKAKTNRYIKALLSALAVGDGYINSLIPDAMDQLSTRAATGKWLDAIGAKNGIIRSQDSGIGDDVFRKVIPIAGSAPKQVGYTIQKLLDVVYGPYATAANITASIAEPYQLHDGSELSIRVDANTVTTIIFNTADANSLSAATAEELATAISRKTDGQVIGSVLTDPRTSATYLNLRTATIGSQGFVQILGGDAQSVFRFPHMRETVQVTSNWAVTRSDTADQIEYSLVSGSSLKLIDAGVKRGDFVTVRTDSGFNLANTGTFEVSEVLDQDSFRVFNNAGTPQTATNSNLDDFTFFRSDTSNILLYRRHATVFTVSPQKTVIILPVTAPIIRRNLRGGTYFKGGVSTGTAATSTTLDLSNASEFPSSGAIKKMSARNLASSIISSVSSTTISLTSAESFPTSGAVFSSVTRLFYYYSSIVGNTLQGVTPAPDSSIISSEAKYVERYKYTSKTGNTLNGVFPDPTSLAGFDVALCGAAMVAGQPGPFLFDPAAEFTLSSDQTTLSAGINQGDSNTIIRVADCSLFPASGYVVFESNTGAEEGPVQYLGKIGSTSLVISPRTPFSKSHLTGTQVRLVNTIGPYTPRTNGADYAAYITSAAPARDQIQAYIKDLVAENVVLEFVILTPALKFTTPVQYYASSSIATSL
jgi:hypothetical protein